MSLSLLPFDSITQSMLGQYSRCGEQFRRVYGLGCEPERIPPGIAAIRGTSVHKAASRNHRHIAEHKQRMPKTTLMEIADAEYHTVLKEGVSLTEDEAADKDKAMGKGLDEAVKLAGVYSDEISPTILIDPAPTLIEERIFIDFGGQVPLSGQIDVLNGDDTIRDFKTASARKNESYGQNNLQAALYTLAARKHTGRNHPFRFDVLVALKTPVAQTIMAVVTENEEMQVISRAKQMLRGIQAGVFSPANPTDSWWCSPKWCGFYSTCPYIHPTKYFIP